MSVTGARASRQGAPALITALLVLVAAVVGLIVRPADARVFRYVLEPGQSRTYEMSIHSVFTPQGIPGFAESIDETITGKMTMKVIEVRKDGSSLIELSMSELSVTGDTGPPEIGTMRMLVSKSGKLLDIEGTGILGGFDFGALLGGQTSSDESFGATSVLPSLPEQAIGPGSEWTLDEEVPLPFGDQKLRTTVRGVHQGYQDTTYGEAARLNLKSFAPLDFGFSFADIFRVAGGAVPQELRTPELEAFRMVITGNLFDDQTALLIPETGDLVKMQADIRMNFGFRFENAPAELGGQGGPEGFRMIGTIRMKLDRIA